MTNDEFSKYEDMLISIVNRFRRSGCILDYDELYSIGALAVVKADKTYRENRNMKKSTYFYNWINWDILKELKNYKRIQKQIDTIKEIDPLQFQSNFTEKEAIEELTLEEYIKEFQLILTPTQLDIFINRYINNISIDSLALKYEADNRRISKIIHKSKHKLKNKSYRIREEYKKLLTRRNEEQLNHYCDPATFTEICDKYSSNINYIDNLHSRQLHEDRKKINKIKKHCIY